MKVELHFTSDEGKLLGRLDWIPAGGTWKRAIDEDLDEALVIGDKVVFVETCTTETGTFIDMDGQPVTVEEAAREIANVPNDALQAWLEGEVPLDLAVELNKMDKGSEG